MIYVPFVSRKDWVIWIHCLLIMSFPVQIYTSSCIQGCPENIGEPGFVYFPYK